MHQQQEWERGNWGGGAQGSYREEASSHCVGIPKVSHGHGWPLASRCVPSILPGAGWKVEVNLPLANGAAAELDVHGDVGDCLEAQGCDGEGRGEGHVRQASLSLLERAAAGRLHDDSTGDGETTRGGGGELAGGRDEGRPRPHGGRRDDAETRRGGGLTGGHDEGGLRAGAWSGGGPTPAPPCQRRVLPLLAPAVHQGRRKVWKRGYFLP